MASCSRDGNSSDDDIPCVITKYNRKPKNVVRSDSDEDSDVEIKPKSKKKVKRLRESDVETDEDAALPRTNSISGSNRSADENSSAIRNDLSDGEQSEKCAICLSKFLGQDVATPENCDHTFCSECLQKWAKKVNTCPIDRLKFNLIFERHHWENRINRKISVENPNRFILVESDSSEATFCEFCGECESEDTLLLCDECELGFHCHCLNPPLESVPIGLWYCPDCAPFVTLHQEIFSDFQRLVQGRFRRHPSRQLVPREEPLDNIVNVREDNRLTAQSTTRLRPWQNSQSAELFSSDSSDENTDDNRSNTRRWHCQEIRNRRQQRWPSPLNSIRERIIAKMRRVNSVQRSFTPSPSTANNMQNLFTARALEELIDGFDDNGSVITHHPVSQPRIAHRAKELISSHSASNQNSTHAGSSFRSPSPPSSFDLVGDILQTQSIIHTPSVILQRDGTLSLNASTVGQQRPSNPAQKAASNNGGNSQQNATYASSSSSSSVSGSSQYYDHCNATGSAAVVTDGASAYGTDSCRTITNRSYGSTFLPDELKKDGHDSSHSKETRKTHSDEEVDIYSDIESAGEEDTAMDEEVEPVRVAYKCNAPQLGNMGDGTDSSDNELIIDEDAHVEEDGERMKEKCKTNTDGKLMEMHHTEHSDAVGVSDDSGGSDLEESDHDQPCETNTEENINSFDGLDDASRENNSNLQLDHESNESYEHATGQTDVSHENNSNLQLDHESNESFEPVEGQTGKDNLPIKSDIESDIDSREENSVDNEADEENSLSSTKNSFFNTVEDRSGLGTPSPSETAIPIHKNSFEKCLERNANAESTTSPTIKRRDSIPAEDMEDIECDENAQPDDDENVAQPDDDDDENVAQSDDDDDENVAHPDDDENGAQPDDDDDENGAHPDDGENGAQPDADDENVAQSDDDDDENLVQDEDENLVQDEDENIAQSDENIAQPDDDDENVAQPDENDENGAQPDEDDENDAQPDEDDENGAQPDEDEEVDQVMNSNDGLLNNQNDGSEQITNENCSMQSDESGAQEGYESEVNNNENDDLPGNSELSEHSKHEHSELSEHSKHEHCDDNNVKDVKSDGEISDSEHSFAGILSKEETIAKNTNAENKCMQNSINDLRELLNYNRNLDGHPNKSKDASLSEQLKKYTNKKTWPRNNTEVSSECLSESYSQPTNSRFGYERNVASTEVECTSPTEMCKMNEKHHQMEINIENQDSTCFEQNVMDLNQSQNSETSPANEDGIVDTQNADLGIEDISEAGSDELNQNEGNIADIMECDSNDQLVLSAKQKELDDVEKNVAQLFNQDGDSLRKERKSMLKDGSSRNITNDSKNYYSSHQSSHMLEEDHEEGEIIEDLPLQKKDSRRDHKHEQYMHEDVEDYIDSIPRINISDLPRIPKIKRDGSKKNVPEELPLEVKRTSVLGRVDLGSSDISWKRLSKHTRERSYRDGRPKDERLLYREREGRAKDKKTKDNESERRGDEKYRESERKKDDSKKQEVEKCKDKNQHERSRDRKSDKNKDDYDKPMKSLEWGYGSQEKRDKEKHGKQHKDKHERDQKDRSKRERDKDRHDKSKERSNRDDDKYEREKVRNVERYDREIERYEQDEGRYEKITFEKEKPKEKEHKHKHKDRKSESGKKSCKDDKHKRSHSREHFTEKQREREVRKVDDKLKIVVEHKESRKDKADKHSEKKESKHEKKHRDSVHRHHEHRRKESITSPYTEIAPIESKEIFAKGDSIIINVNFNRASPKETVPFVEEEPCSRDKKPSCDLPKVEQLVIAQDIRISKSKHSLHDKDKNVLEILGNKRPTTPPERPERNTQMSVGECYWKETDDMDVKSPPFEKCSTEKICSDEEEDVMTPEENFGADDNFTDSDHDNLPETQVLLPKEEETEQSSILEKNTTESIYTKEIDSFNPPRRRSPRSPSPPSPPDNDSYDPCEPTRSPSPPPDLPAPPLPTMSMPERPKPPPSPELPPLPPEPEPMDVIMRDDPRAQKINPPCPSSEISPSSAVSNSITSQQAMLYTQTTVSSPLSMPNVLLPPPNFHPHSAPRNVSSVPQLVPPRTMNWQVSNPPPPPMLFPPNHVQQVIHGNFLSSQLPATGMPPNVSVTSQLGPMLQHANTLPIMSQVRHSQLSAHAAVPSNSLLPNVPLNHLNISQMQMQHLNHPPPNMSVTIPGQHQSISIPNQQNNLPVSVHNQAGIRVISSQGQLSNIIVSLQNQHSNSVTTVQSHVANHPVSAHSQVPIPTANIAVAPSQKLEKTKHSPTNERNEVVDMEVDSPYSPGDSPSMDSAYDYSPSVSPTTKNAPLSAFDTLLGPQQRLTTGQDSGTKAASEKTPNKRLGSDLKNSVDVPNKKAKSESRSESSGKVRHAVRLQVSDKVKTVSRREQKLVEKRLDDSQLKILDELPSSAVEMQVKEKFLKKLNRQERVVEEVKLALKPYYKTRDVNKEEYKDILRKSVPKICHNRSGDINPVKVKYLVECYVKKIKHTRKKASKKHKSKFS